MDGERLQFCSYCGTLGEAGRRVCPGCGLGVVLTTTRAALLQPGEPFLIVTGGGRVSAASGTVDSLLGRPEHLVGAPVETLLRASGDGPSLTDAIERAARGSAEVVTLTVETVISDRGAARFHARVAACGDPAAALVVLEPGDL